ncbi:MAG: diguanylate cyclase [Bacteroides graminisolvens]|nr:diguanylate cyclase [Bacteroides graminisolvens]
MEDSIRRLDSSRNLPFTILAIDVNGLKLTNDAFGHRMGNILLMNVASMLKRVCREDDIIGRMGGDEFMVNKAITKLKNNINSIRIESVTPVKDVVSDTKAVFRGVTKAVKTSLEEGNDTALRKAFRTYGIEGLKATSTRLKEINATEYKNLINKLDDAINKVETTIKNKNSNVVSPSTAPNTEVSATTDTDINTSVSIEIKENSITVDNETIAYKIDKRDTNKPLARNTKSGIYVQENLTGNDIVEYLTTNDSENIKGIVDIKKTSPRPY